MVKVNAIEVQIWDSLRSHAMKDGLVTINLSVFFKSDALYYYYTIRESRWWRKIRSGVGVCVY
jgi:hypothetical protein